MERLEKKLEWSESALLHKEEDLISALGENQKLAVDLRRAMARLHVQHEEQFSDSITQAIYISHRALDHNQKLKDKLRELAGALQPLEHIALLLL